MAFIFLVLVHHIKILETPLFMKSQHRNSKLFYRKSIMVLGISALVGVLLVFLSNWTINHSTEGKTFHSLKDVPHQRTGLLLGTSKTLRDGRPNPYYENRIKATTSLFKASKIERVIISGDNSRAEYDEPTMMRTDLISLGIDSTKIFLDYAGFRTLDSMVRAKEIFGQDSVTVISQEFHNQRAIYLASYAGVYAIGYNAKDVVGSGGIKTSIREYFARCKVFLDLIIGKEPHFLGEKIRLE